MLLYPSINTLNEKTDSRYSLVILAAKRARDIVDGKPALTEEESERPVSQAAKEVADDMITYTRPVRAEAAEITAEVDEAIEAEAVESAEEAAEEAAEPEAAEAEETETEEAAEAETEEASEEAESPEESEEASEE